MKYMLGVDIGSQSIRSALFDLNGKCVGIASVEQYMDTPHPGWATQEPMFWWQSVGSTIQSAMAKANVSADSIISVGVCAVMHSPVPVAKDGRLLSRSVQLYCDKRASEIADRLDNRADMDRILLQTANAPTSNWFGLKIKWIQENEPAVYDNTFKFLTPKDFINFMLTGETCIDHSEASGSFLMDQESEQWASELVKLVGIDLDKLPKIVSASTVIGAVTERASQHTGLKPGTPVVAGGGDMLCSLLTSGLTRKGRVVDLTGTGSVISFFDGKPILDKRIMNLRHVIPGWVPFGCVDSSGGAFRWFRDVLAKKETDIARGMGQDEYAYLSELAEKTPHGADGMLFYPYLMGERTLGSPYSRGIFLGMNLGTAMGHMVRALLEGVAFEHRRTLEIVENYGTTVEAVYHTGGGAKGDLWSQIKADIYQKPVYTLEATEGSVQGAALLGGVGAGALATETEAADMVTKIKKEFIPDESKAERYNQIYEVFKEIHDLLQGPFEKLARIS